MTRRAAKIAPPPPDPRLVRLVQALAKQAAREDHAADQKDIFTAPPKSDQLTTATP